MADDVADDGLRRAVEIARGHPDVAAQLGQRTDVLFARPHLASRTGPETHAIVGFYDYDQDRTLVATVDTSTGDVLSADESGEQFQLTVAERREAEQLASSDERVRAFLQGRDMRPLTRLYLGHGESAHRRAVVFLRPSSRERAYAIVDLSARSVEDVRDRDELGL